MYDAYLRVSFSREGYLSMFLNILFCRDYHFHSLILTIRESSSSSSSKVSNPIRNFLQAVYENDLDEYGSIHTWLDVHHPEPAWRRKRSPINVFFELKYFTSLVYLCGQGQLLMNCFRELVSRISF